MRIKLLFLASFIFCLAASGQAQNMRVGFKFGGNLSTLTEDRDEEFGYKSGIHGGILFDFSLNQNFSVQPEVLFSGRGAEFNPDREFDGDGLLVNSYTQEGKIRYNYLEVPVMAKFKIGGFFVEAGPHVSFLLKSEIDRTTRSTLVGGAIETTNESNSQQSISNKLDYGLAAGIGYLAENGFALNLRYLGGFHDIYKNEDLPNSKHTVFQLGISYYVTD